MKSHPFLMNCHKCGKQYDVPYARRTDIDRIVNVLKFALCPHCGTPRDVVATMAYSGQKHCIECYIPESLLTSFWEVASRKGRYKYPFRDGKCVCCYSRESYLKRGLAFVVNKPIKPTIET